MKKTLLTLTIASLLLSTSQANAEYHDGEHHGRGQMHNKKDFKERMKKHHAKMAKQLNLTDEQKEKAKALREEARKEMEPLMEQKKNLREKTKAIREKHMAKFEAILTPEQKEKLEEIKSKHKQKFQKDRD